MQTFSDFTNLWIHQNYFPMPSVKLKLFQTNRIALSSFVLWNLEEKLFPWCWDGRDSHFGAELQLMSERQCSIIGPVCACGEETVLCLWGLRLCLASLTGGRGRSIRASCSDTAQKRLWLWLLQSEHWPTVYHHTWQGKADHAASHTQSHNTHLKTATFWPEFWLIFKIIIINK